MNEKRLSVIANTNGCSGVGTLSLSLLTWINKLQKLEDALVKQMLTAADRADQAERDDWTDLAEVADWADRVDWGDHV